MVNVDVPQHKLNHWPNLWPITSQCTPCSNVIGESASIDIQPGEPTSTGIQPSPNIFAGEYSLSMMWEMIQRLTICRWKDAFPPLLLLLLLLLLLF